MKYVRKHIKSLSPEFNVNFKGNDEREANSALCYLPVADCEVDDGKNVGKHPACSALPRIITVIMFTTSMVITLGAQETCYCLHLCMLTTPETHNPSALGRRCYYCQLYCVLSNLNSCYIIRYSQGINGLSDICFIGPNILPDTVEDRLSRWKEDKAKRRESVNVKKTALKKSAPLVRKAKSPKTPIRDRLAKWRKKKEQNIAFVSKPKIEAVQKKNSQHAKTATVSKPKITAGQTNSQRPKATAPKVDIIARNKMLAAKRRDLPLKSDTTKRRETFLLAPKKTQPVRPKAPPTTTPRVPLTAKALQTNSTLSRRTTISAGQQAMEPQKNRRVTIATEGKKPVATKFRNVPSRIDSGLKSLKRKSVPGELKTPKRARVDVLRSLNTPKSCVRFKATPVLARNTPVRKEMSMREKLNSWLLSHGKTPSKFHHLLCLDDAKTSNEAVDGGLSVLDLNLQQQILNEECDHPDAPDLNQSLQEGDKLSALLNEIESLTNAGCPVTTLSGFMDGIASDIPSCKQSADYWVRRAEVAKLTCNQDTVLKVFDEAVEHRAEPAEVIAAALQQYVSETMIGKTTSGKENAFHSSAVKYCFTNTKSTPFFKKYRPSATEADTPSALITPVRRSTRKSHLGLPTMLQDHDVVVESLAELHQDSLRTALFVPNRALALSDDEDY
ncbi:hypothetical protein CAPTEDRAFT_220803 [Capitella teleta]|uniref:Uncharacterized protein n=1 Tax=Capitella teleta TaxID=283909 RepID=R7U8Z6_CAPTE|nr:hypothetical protein CAPTEDRAFT_220803 [Capitella teleta]|eukprot:ELU00172.1 hypothetical protein CAPTEDRAFT_220803 [Capitella teleta]